MPKTVAIGQQDFENVQQGHYFYIDKTGFIKEWWESGDSVTLIARPRRFGKTLNMSMVEKFFSTEYTGRSDLFEGLSIWQEEKYQKLQGTWPVIALSFAKVKETTYLNAKKQLCLILTNLYNQFDFLLDSGKLNESEKAFYHSVSTGMDDYIAADALNALSNYLMKYYGKKVIILLDEYDTPLQEAYIGGYWEEMVFFIRNLFNATFKTNPCLERAIMTGITRISKESIFSDLNNLKVVTTTSKKYADSFGFTEKEVFAALEEYGLSNQKQKVKEWYDGFSFGDKKDIYNPWSIINFLSEKKTDTYWANSSSNSLAGQLIRKGSSEIKMAMEVLLQGGIFHTSLDEQIVFNQLEQEDSAVWSLLLAGGYLTAVHCEFNAVHRETEYSLKLTNFEVLIMFEHMVKSWFGRCRKVNNAFLQAMVADDVKAMNTFMNKIALQTFSYFDTGKNPFDEAPERFYHGFVLGMMVELEDRYVLTSNRESGFGRYDVMLEPRNLQEHAIIIEFKVHEDKKELSETVREALQQINERNYQANLVAKGIPETRIKKYGFAFRGKEVLIGTGSEP